MSMSPNERHAYWVRYLEIVPIPVLQATRESLARWQEQPDRVDANGLADTILRDPLMTLRLLTHVSRELGDRLATPVETVTAALVLFGIDPFFRAFSNLPTVEERLADHPQALEGVMQAITRAHRAARLAAAFAIHRQDEDAEVQQQAALLDNFSGLLLWCEAPLLALEIASRQRQDTTRRSADVQRELLGVDLHTLEQELMENWRLPNFMRQLTQEQHASRPGPRSVMLAVRIARHSQGSWNNAALPDDYADLGNLLNLAPPTVAKMVRQQEDNAWAGP